MPSIAIVGATGLVGRTMLKVLEERNFPVSALRLLASERSAGEVTQWKGEEYTVEVLDENSFDNIDIALFSAGGSVSKEFAPIAASKGCIAIDNSSAWRMDPSVPLIVPEVNPYDVKGHNGIIANPNCSTIQLVVVLKPIQDKYGLQRVIVSTYQTPSGAGQKGIDHLLDEVNNQEPKHRISKHPVAYNTVFHSFPDGELFTEEEIKVKRETRKILGIDHLPVAVTCVRVPVLGGHGESVIVKTDKNFSVEDLRETLRSAKGIVVVDNPLLEEYPTTSMSNQRDEVFVGRLRIDDSTENSAHLWITADNLRKGAATNAVQIAELLLLEE